MLSQLSKKCGKAEMSCGRQNDVKYVLAGPRCSVSCESPRMGPSMNETVCNKMDLGSGAAQAQTIKEKAKAGDFECKRLRRLRVAFWLVAGITGFLQIWLQDYTIFGDTLSYLDSGDMLWRADFANAISSHWSPGFAFLLGFALKIVRPVGLWEVAVVKLVNFCIFLFTLGAFDYFVNQFCRYQERSAVSENPRKELIVPKLALATVGYLLFVWTITQMLPAWFALPDMLVMAIVFVIFGLLLKIKMGSTGFALFAILGAVLGCGFLVKAPLFPLAFMFLGIAFLLVGDFKKAVPRIALSFGLFALIAAPLVWKLSVLDGGLTFGKSAAWNYARTVNGIALPYHWHGEPPGSGTPLHPTRILFQTPTVYEFGSPVRGTYPPWRDPYYWFAGITPHFDLAGQWRVIKGNARILKEQASGLNRSFVYGFLILVLMRNERRPIGRVVAKQWFLLLPAIAAIAMFSVVLVEGRYIAPYPIVIGLVAFSCLAVVRSASSLRLVNRSVLLAAVLFAASSVRPAAAELRSFAKSLHKNELLGRGGPWHVSNQAVSDALTAHGLQREDKIAYIGKSEDFYWARLARVQVNAEIRQWDTNYYLYSLVSSTRLPGLEHSVDIYWASPPQLKERIDRVLYNAGSKAIVTDAFPAGGGANGWDHVPGTLFYIHLLADPTGGSIK
jgi:hypothetical protein